MSWGVRATREDCVESVCDMRVSFRIVRELRLERKRVKSRTVEGELVARRANVHG